MSDLINHKLIEENKLECVQNWCDLFGKNILNSSQSNRRIPLEKDPITRIINRLKIKLFFLLLLTKFILYYAFILLG